MKPIDTELEAALRQLDRLEERAPDLSESVAFYRAVLPVLREAEAGVAPFTLEGQAAHRKLSAGLPLLVDEELPLDLDAVRTLLLKLCRIAEDVGLPAPASSGSLSWLNRGQADASAPVDNADPQVSRKTDASEIRRAVERHELDIVAVTSALAAGCWHEISPIVTDLGLNADLLRMLVQNALKPSFRVWAKGLKDMTPLGHWRHGECPFCGSPPALAEIQGKEGARFHRCAMCGAMWPYPRLQCAFCANDDHRSLNVIHVEGEEEKYRVQVCDRCRGYLKFVVTFEPTPIDQLVVEDLATLHLDLIAVEREFTHSPV